jgi:hypothetical protein
MILKGIKELGQRVWTDPGSGVLWKLRQIRVPSRYYGISTSGKKEPRMHVKEYIWIVVSRPKRTTKSKSSRAQVVVVVVIIII